MIIEKIEIENFTCYAGKIEFDFTEGINVIIGDNGYGKSQLYNAFYWVMYNQIFVKEKDEFVETKFMKSAIVSDKAKADRNAGKVSASVKITFHNIERDNVYILERKYSINIKDGVLVENNDSEFSIVEKELSYLNGKMIQDKEEQENIKNRILPAELKPYLWFQGEQVESIIDFNKQDSLTQAINVLSSIKRYDQLKALASSAAKTANVEYDREIKRLSKDLDKSEQLARAKTKAEAIIADLHKEENDIKENLSRAEAKCEQLINKLGDAQKVNELKQQKKGLISLLNDLNDTLKREQVSFHRKMFRNKWVLKGTENLQDAYAKRFSDFEAKKLEQVKARAEKAALEQETVVQLQTRLPFNVPEPNYVQWMLQQERCLVCDREAAKGSEAWNKIQQLIASPEKKVKPKDDEPLAKQDFNDDFKRLYTNGLSLRGRIEGIGEEINETLTRIRDINLKVKEENRNVQKVEESIQKLLSDASLTMEGSADIVNEYSIQNKKAKNFADELNKTTQQIEHHRNSLKAIDDQLKDLVTGEIQASLVEKKTVLNDFETITTSTRDRVFNNLIAQLEKEANTHYAAMTAGNRSARGRIKLRKLSNGNYMPEISDDKGNPLLGSNTSNLILVKLAAIMAIISAKSNSGLVNLYTLITDAPTSVFGEDYTIGFCKTISRVYRQSIIMSKEFYKNQALRNELLSNPEIKIGKVYMITPSIPENDRDNRNNLTTNIEKLN